MRAVRRALPRALSVAVPVALAAATAAASCQLMQPDAKTDINGQWTFDAVQSCATGAPCPQSHGLIVLVEHSGALSGTAHITGEPGLAADSILVNGYKNGATISFVIATCSLAATVFQATPTTIRGSYDCGTTTGTWNSVRYSNPAA